jgi:hypothetical protein
VHCLCCLGAIFSRVPGSPSICRSVRLDPRGGGRLQGPPQVPPNKDTPFPTKIPNKIIPGYGLIGAYTHSCSKCRRACAQPAPGGLLRRCHRIPARWTSSLFCPGIKHTQTSGLWSCRVPGAELPNWLGSRGRFPLGFPASCFVGRPPVRSGHKNGQRAAQAGAGASSKKSTLVKAKMCHIIIL